MHRGVEVGVRGGCVGGRRVGGGAGGLELAAKLGRRFGPDVVTLVDSRPFHIWKPSLHEAAAGTLDNIIIYYLNKTTDPSIRSRRIENSM